MKEKKCVCVDVCAHVCVCVRVGLVLRVDGESCGSYILSQWPAGAYLEPQGLGYFIFPKHKPQAFATHTHTYTHTCLQKRCLAWSQFVRIVYYIQCFPVEIPLLSSLQVHLQYLKNKKISAFYNRQTAGSSEKGS